MAQQRFDLRSKSKDPVVVEIVKRLNSQPVSRTKKRLAVAVPNGEREHTAELLDTGRAELLVRMYDRFGVAPGDVMVAGAFEFGPDRSVVENFSVEGNPLGPVLVRHRLVAAGNVDDAEAAMTKEGSSVLVHAMAVRSTMPDRFHHVPYVCGRARDRFKL